MSSKRIMYALFAATLFTPFAAANAATTDNPIQSYEDGAPVVLTGTINEVRDNEFDLSYGSGAVTVELRGWQWTGREATYLSPGETVTVSGRIDDDLFEGREIKADNIYIQNEYVYYYTDDAYPSYYMLYDQSQNNQEGSYVSMRGTVSDIDEDEFTLTSLDGKTRLEVDTGDLGYNPFDDEGMQKITNGSAVHVYGNLDNDLFDSREIEAESIVVLSQAGNYTTQGNDSMGGSTPTTTTN